MCAGADSPMPINAKRIARNTVWLYLRHLISFAAGIAALGIVVKPLGVDGFGLFSAVSGVAGAICFFGSALGETFRKFLSREIGTANEKNVRQVFATALGLTLASVIFALVVLETVGCVFVFHVLSIPSGSEGVAFFCYECAIGVALSGVLRIPFESLIYAHERMSRFAAASAVEALCAGLTVAVTVLAPQSLRLTAYVVMSALGEVVLLVVFAVLSRRFAGFGLRPALRTRIRAEMMEFVSCGLVRAFSVALEYIGIGLLVNVFAGVAFSATWKLATQVGSALYVLVGNFHLSFAPQMMRLHADEDRRRLAGMVVRTSAVSFSVMLCAAVPVMVFAPELVRAWVGTPPPQVAAFIRALAVHFIFDALNGPLHCGITAISNAPRYQLTVAFVKVFGFLLAFAALAFGFPPWFAPAGMAFANSISFVYRTLVFRSFVRIVRNQAI